MRCLAAISLSLVLAVCAEARNIREVTPEELAAAAEIVANGRVESVKLTDERSELRLGENTPAPTRIAEARVTTLGTSKGSIGPEFLLRFPQLDLERVNGAIVNGPLLINLEAGKRYRFYLKNKNGSFVGALDGAFDDAPAVQPLAEDESDQNAPLLKDEVLKLATAEFRKVRPGVKIHTTIAEFSSFGKGRWNISFYSDPPLSYPSFTSEAKIVVDASRRISHSSWIGEEKPRTGDQLVEKDIGRRVRLTVEGRFSGQTFEPSTGGFFSLIGKIDQIGKNSVSGTFIDPGSASSEPQSLSFPTAALRSVQRLAEK